MKEVLETIIKSLVDSPEAIEIKEVENEKHIRNYHFKFSW